MPTDLVELTANANIAISTLSLMLKLAVGAIVGLCGFIVFLMKNCREDNHYALETVKELTQAINGSSSALDVIKEFAKEAAREART
jgi:hypothetical protein